MRYTCTIYALALIDSLDEELEHLRIDAGDVGHFGTMRALLFDMKKEVRRIYNELHPNERLPENAATHEIPEGTEAGTGPHR